MPHSNSPRQGPSVTGQQPTDHIRALPASVVARCADTDSAHGLPTDDRRPEADGQS